MHTNYYIYEGSTTMITEKGTMTTEVIYNDTKTERYRLTKIWKPDKHVSLLMIQAGSANEVVIDMTNLYCIRNLHALGYGGFDILNISSVIAERLDAKELTLSETNVQEIINSIVTIQSPTVLPETLVI